MKSKPSNQEPPSCYFFCIWFVKLNTIQLKVKHVIKHQESAWEKAECKHHDSVIYICFTFAVLPQTIFWLHQSARHLHFRAFSRRFRPKRLTVIHTLMAVAAMQRADQHIRNSLGFSNIPKDTLSCRPGESNQQPSENKMLDLPPEPQPPLTSEANNIDYLVTM